MKSIVLALALALALVLSSTTCTAATYILNSLADSEPGAPLIPGTIRDALSQGDRVIKVQVKGQIDLYASLVVGGSNVKLDAYALASPGLTINGWGLIIAGVTDVEIRGLRIINTQDDGVQVRDGAARVKLIQLTVRDFFDGGIDITDGAHDVEVLDSWIHGGKHMLIKYGPSRVTVARSLFTGHGPAGAGTRSPQACWDDPCSDALTGAEPMPTVSFINNVVYNWGIGYGTWIARATANVINNFYSSPLTGSGDDALTVDANALAYTAGNVLHIGDENLNETGNLAAPIPHAGTPYPVSTCQAARNVRQKVGVRFRTASEQAFIDTIDLGPCE